MKLDRRRFLQMASSATALGMTGLPIFSAFAQNQSAPIRLLVIAKNHGWSSRGANEDLVITDAEASHGFRFPYALEPLEAIKNQLLIVDGLHGTFWGNGHDVSYSDLLTASVPANENGSSLNSHFPLPAGPSLDWVLQQHLQKSVLRMSLGYRSWGMVHHPLCFDDRANMLSMHTSAHSARDEVLQPILQAQGSGSEQTQLQNQLNQAIFKILGKDVEKLEQVMRNSGAEYHRIENFKQSLSAIDPTTAGSGATFTEVAQALSIPEPYGQNLSTTSDLPNALQLIELAFRADTHRIAVLGINHSEPNWSWTDLEGNSRIGNPTTDSFHHGVAHYSGDAVAQRAFDGSLRLHFQSVVNLAQRLSNITDVDGSTVLDNTIILLTSEVGTGMHDRRRKPHILIGGRNAGLNLGRVIKPALVDPRNRMGALLQREDREGGLVTWNVNYGEFISEQSHADLLVALGRVMGLSINQFGLSSLNKSPLSL